MLIIPGLYVKDGECVSYYRARTDQPTVVDSNPLPMARRFAKQGATRLHVVDLDGNIQTALHIAKNTSLEVQCELSDSSAEKLNALFKGGVARVSLTQHSEALLADALARYGAEKILFTIRTERAVVEGHPEINLPDYGIALKEKGVQEIIFRDLHAEGTLHPNFDEVDRLILATGVHVTSFGGVGTMSDLELLKKTGAHAAIISLAFLENRLSLAECMRTFQ